MKRTSLPIKLLWFSMAGFPLAFLLLLSVSASWRFPDSWPGSLSLAHWRLALDGQQGLARIVLNSFFISTTVGLFSSLSGFFTASVLAYDKRRGWWLRLAYLPYASSPVIYAYLLLYYFHRSGLSGSVPGLLVAHFIITYPFAVIFFFRHFDTRLQSLGQLARSMGANTRQVYSRVYIPASRKMLWLAFFQCFLISWFEYGLSTVVGLGQVRVLSLSVYQYIGEANIYLAAIASLMLCAPPLLLLFVSSRR